MKIATIILILFSVSCQGQSNKKDMEYTRIVQPKVSDTLYVLILKNILQENYKVLYLSFDESSGDKIRLLKNDNVVIDISLPITDIDVKNFSIDSIEEIDKGFKLSVNWGGGNNLYGRSFYFEYRKNMFYLCKVENRNYSLEPENKTLKEEKISPPIRIDEFILSKYIKNE